MSNDISYIQGDIKCIKENLNIVEEVTAKNWNEIIQLKKIRQA